MNTSNSTPPPRIGWCISGDHSIASSRLQGFLIHEEFVKMGLDSTLIATNFNFTFKKHSIRLLLLAHEIIRSGFQVVIFERPNWMMYKLSAWCRLNGIRTIAIRCDPLPGPYEQFFDATIVPTHGLRSLLDLPYATVIEDMIEVPNDLFKSDYDCRTDKLRLVWVGHGSYREFILNTFDELSAILRRRDVATEFVTISKGAWATHEWSIDTVYRNILNCDVALLPMPDGANFAAKSANRLTMMMALGMPTVASEIPSYMAFAINNENCVLARGIDEFANAICSLQDAAMRKRLGFAARARAWRYASPRTVAATWLHCVDDLVRSPKRTIGPFGIRDRALARLLST